MSQDFACNSCEATALQRLERLLDYSLGVCCRISSAAATVAHQWHRMWPAVILATKRRQQTGALLGPGALCLEFGEWFEFHQDHWTSRFCSMSTPATLTRCGEDPDVSVEATRCRLIGIVNDK